MRDFLKKIAGAVARAIGTAAAVVVAGATIAVDLLTFHFRRNHRTMDTMYERNQIDSQTFFTAKTSGLVSGLLTFCVFICLGGPVSGIVLGFLAESYVGGKVSRAVIGPRAYDYAQDSLVRYGDFEPMPVTKAVANATVRGSVFYREGVAA